MSRLTHVSPFGLPQSPTFRPKAFLRCSNAERPLSYFTKIWSWYFKCVFWLLKGMKLYALNIRDGAELESLNCLKVRDLSRLTPVSNKSVPPTPEDVCILGFCLRSYKKFCMWVLIFISQSWKHLTYCFFFLMTLLISK